MKYREPSTMCSREGCERPRRLQGRYCSPCHAAWQKENRAARLAEMENSAYHRAVRAAKKRILMAALREEQGNLCRAAVRLGVHRNTLTRALKEVGLTIAQVRAYLRADTRQQEAA
jgi:DNA-binding NtrC family response regulator